MAPLSAWVLRHRDFPNPKWRAYNPSVCRFGGNLLMAYRFQPLPDPNDEDLRSSILLCRVTDDMRGTEEHVAVEGLRGLHQEDPRLFIHDGKLHLAYSVARYPAHGFWGCHMELAQLKKTKAGWKAAFHYPLNLGANRADKEKNWQFFSRNGSLCCVYKIVPHVIFDIAEGTARGFEYQPPWRIGTPHGGTPPVSVDGFWFSFFHAWQENSDHARLYHLGAYAFDDGGKVTGMTQVPLLSASEANGFVFNTKKVKWHPLVVFPCGAVFDEKEREWLISFGVNDSYCALMRLKHSFLAGRLQRPQRSGDI